MAVKLTPSTSLFRNTDTSGPQPWLTLGTELDAPADPPVDPLPSAPAPLRLTTLIAAIVTPAAPVVDLNGAAGGTSATLDYTENQSLTPIAPGATVTDADSANFDTGVLTVAFTANGTADDRLQIKDGGTGIGRISVSETDVYYDFGHVDANNFPVGPELIGSYSGGTDGFTPLSVALNANATPTATQALVEAIGYFNISNAPSTAPRTVTYTLTDESGHASNPVTATINVTAVVDPPVVNGDTFGTDENVPLSGNLFADNGGGNDYSPDGTPLQITAINGSAAAVGQQIVLPSGATLIVNADGSFTYNPNGAFDSLVPSSSGASNTFGTDSFTYSTTGGGGATAQVFINGVESAGDIYKGSSGNDTITGSGNSDFFLVQQGVAPFPASHDTVNGLGGNDTFYFGGALISADVVDGGPGTDQIAIQGNYTGGNALTLGTGVVSVESLAILPGSDTRFGDPGTNSYSYDVTTQDVNVAAGAQLVVDANRLRVGENFTFNGTAETDGSFFIYGGLGTDDLHGGARNDVFLFGTDGS
ncbi:MAG: hypothetical protein QOH81_1591, partial [Sphingomonadales bacterium]|nr:hypothetical protein [Sphingomonadales bacterium]